jgi:hypothetical protein
LFEDALFKLLRCAAQGFQAALERFFSLFAHLGDEFVACFPGFLAIGVVGAFSEDLGKDQFIQDLRFAHCALIFGHSLAAHRHVRLESDEGIVDLALFHFDALPAGDYSIGK